MAEDKLKRAAFHPILLALYPLLALISINIDQLQLKEVTRSFGWVVAATLTLYLFTFLLLRNGKRAGLATSLTLVLFFSWGHIFRLIEAKQVAGVLVGRADFLMAAWSSLWILGTWWIIRKLSSSGVKNWTHFLNVASLLVLVFPLLQILSFTLKTARVSGVNSEASFQPVSISKPLSGELPDIYYIILDGYGRADVLHDLYGYDNSEFVGFLRELGFFVAEGSHSNYGQTSLSLSSSLNFAYINDLAKELVEGSTSREPLVEIIRNSRLRGVLSEAGYQMVALASGYNVTEFVDADWYLNQGEVLNSFEAMWLKNSAAAVVIDALYPVWYRARIINNLETLAHIPDTDSPRFVFAHILLPHPPFVFGPNGESLPPKSFREGNYYDGTVEEYIQGYRGQLTYLNKRLSFAISEIIDRSSPEPVVILQGDHGPGAYLNWDHMQENCFKERMSILNAYYLPGSAQDQLYHSISPVNSFRLILDAYLGTELGFLEDRSYFSLWNSLYQLEDISSQLDTCHK